MAGTYAVLAFPNGTIQERNLGSDGSGHTPGQWLPPSWESLHVSVAAGNRTLRGTRKLTVNDSRYVDFDSVSLESLPIIAAIGAPYPDDPSAFRYHGPTGSAVDTLVHSPVVRVGGSTKFEGIAVRLSVTSSGADGGGGMLRGRMSAPDNVWFAMGFGTQMSQEAGTYAIVVTEKGEVHEYSLGKKSPGTQLQPTLQNVEVSVTAGSIRVVTFDRNASIADEKYHSVDVGSAAIPLILARSATAWPSYHGANRTVTSVSMTPSFRLGGAAAGTAVPTGVRLDGVSPHGTATITMSGPGDKWLATGFGATLMSDAPWTLAVLGSGEVEERKIAKFSPGTKLDLAGYVEASTITGGSRRVVYSRSMAPSDSNRYNFVNAQSALSFPIISAVGTGANLSDVHCHNSDTCRAAADIRLDELTRMQGSVNVLQCSATKKTSCMSNGGVMVGLEISPDSDEVLITLEGPNNVWFGVGFDAQQMGDGPYSIIVAAGGLGISERKLAQYSPGAVLAASLNLVSNNLVEGRRRIVLSRAIEGLTPDHHTFSTAMPPYGAANELSIIAAVGQSAAFAYHGMGNYISTAIWLSPISESGAGELPPPPPTPEPSLPVAPTPAPGPKPHGGGCTPSDLVIDPNAVSPQLYACQFSPDGSQLTVHWRYDSNSTVHFAVKTLGAAGYLGLAFTNPGSAGSMAPADAVLSACAASCDPDTCVTDPYHISDKTMSWASRKDPSQTVTQATRTHSNGITVVRFTRALDNGGMVKLSKNSLIYVNYVHDPDTCVLGYHGQGKGRVGSFSVNIVSGSTADVSDGLDTKRRTHGALMIAAWVYAIPIAILVKRFGTPVFQMGLSQFYSHVFLCLCGVSMTIAGYVIASNNDFGDGAYSHGTLGLVILILACFNPFAGVVFYGLAQVSAALGFIGITPKGHPRRWMSNVVHHTVGRALWVLGVVQCFIGVESLHRKTGADRTPYLIAIIAGLAAFVSVFLTLDGAKSLKDSPVHMEAGGGTNTSVQGPNDRTGLLSDCAE
eukprot:TRINITY_DN3302_c1_g1_i3.p1 TRINITY_DN3302_c1_g1~~TRINITY_DN3302_c1_g1_i3.p1  ORF type:complete len:1131 (+),score=259.42 TRINITY_DN3302_c1_g1_i3:340-3393(+)